MLKIGLTQSTTVNTARESNSYSLSVSTSTVIKTSKFGHPNISNSGLLKEKIVLTYTDVEIEEYENHKQYCSPYVTRDFWVQVINERGLTLLDAPAFLQIDNETFGDNMTKVSYSITVYEL